MKIAETERLVVRWIEESDAPFVLRLLNDPDWLRFIGNRNVHTLDDARKQITERYRVGLAKGFGAYLVELKATQTPLGMCSLIQRDYLDCPDLGFAFLPEYRSQGYAREASLATMASPSARVRRPPDSTTLPKRLASFAA